MIERKKMNIMSEAEFDNILQELNKELHEKGIHFRLYCTYSDYERFMKL